MSSQVEVRGCARDAAQQLVIGVAVVLGLGRIGVQPEPAVVQRAQAFLQRLEVEEAKMRSVIAMVLAREPDAVIPWTGRQMAVAKFLPHMRNEFAIHRWDFAGDDDTSTELLAQPDLTEHAVGVLGQTLLRRGREHDPTPDEDFYVRLRAENAPDVRVVVEAGQAGLELTDQQADEPYVDLDPAARTLVIWGRRPDHRGRFRSHVNQSILPMTEARAFHRLRCNGTGEECARVQWLLSGY